MPLTLAAFSTSRLRLAAACQLLVRGRRDRLAVDLDDQHVAVVLGQGAFAQEDIGRPGQAQDPLLDRRGRRRGPQEHPPESAGDLETHPGGQPAEPADDQRAVAIAGQAERDIQGVDAGAATGAWHEVGPQIGDRPATGLERPLGGVVRDAIAPRLRPGRQIEPSVACLKEQWDQQTAQRPQEHKQGRLEVEERCGPWVLQAISDDLVEPLMGLLPQRFDVRWTRRRGRVNSDNRSWGRTPDRSRLGHVDQRSG